MGPAFFDDNEYADAMELIGMLKDSVREELRRKNDAIREQEEHLREMMEEMGFDADIDLDSESDGVEGEYRKDKGDGDGENIKATERIKSVDEILADMKRTMKEDEQDDGCDYRDEPHKQKSVDELLTDFKHTRDDDKDTADINGDDSDLQEPKKKIVLFPSFLRLRFVSNMSRFVKFYATLHSYLRRQPCKKPRMHDPE